MSTTAVRVCKVIVNIYIDQWRIIISVGLGLVLVQWGLPLIVVCFVVGDGW